MLHPDTAYIQAHLRNMGLHSVHVSLLPENTELCFHVNQITIRFFYSFWFLKESCVWSIIQSRMGLNKKIHGRQCSIYTISRNDANAFLELFHLMGTAKAQTYLGLKYADEWVAVASFSRGRKMNRLPDDKRSYELVRFACKQGITVQGGFTKLIRAFENEFSPGDIMTYADPMWSQGSGLVSSGFYPIDQSSPIYFNYHLQTHVLTPCHADSIPSSLEMIIKNEGSIKYLRKSFSP